MRRSSVIAGALLLVAVLGALDLFVWFADFWLPVESRSSLTIQERVESAGALFSALAFAAVLYTVWLQQQELELQRQELAHTREELRGLDMSALFDVYRSVCHSRTCDLTHYFRNLDHLLRFVDDSEFPDEDKRKYAHVVRAQLTEAENILILFNGLRKVGASRFKLLIERYRLLNELPDYAVLFHAKRAYQPSTFGSSQINESSSTRVAT